MAELRFSRFWWTLFVALFAVGCAGGPSQRVGGVAPHYKIGSAYQINGRWYQPAEDPHYDRVGVASWYGDDFHGKATANGEIFNMNDMTAAHTTLPLPSMVEVQNLDNGRTAMVRVNDRGPFAHDRIIDLSRAAARRLGFEQNGLAKVRVRYVGPAALPGERTRQYARAPKPRPQIAAVTAPAPIAMNDPAPPQRQPTEPKKPTAAHPLSPDANSPDAIAALIADHEDLTAGPFSKPLPATVSPEEAAPAAQASGLYIVRVATLSDLGALPGLRAALADQQPLRIARLETAPSAYHINMGPFNSPDDAAGGLMRAREAGYIDAEIIAITP